VIVLPVRSREQGRHLVQVAEAMSTLPYEDLRPSIRSVVCCKGCEKWKGKCSRIVPEIY
jgi:hypothetical protein